ncbi:MAG: hypothetical protein TREMPRED_005305, partial [Tremellales sp. Tagirdzhanova-0007]
MEETVAGPSQSPSHPVNLQTLDLIDVDGFDWKVFESTYKDRALITRLLHIPDLILNPTFSPTPKALALARAALLRLLPHIRASTWDHGLYLRAVALLDSLLHPGKVGRDAESMDGVKGREETGVPDMDWVEEAMENQQRETSRLDVELRGYLSNLIKE